MKILHTFGLDRHIDQVEFSGYVSVAEVANLFSGVKASEQSAGLRLPVSRAWRCFVGGVDANAVSLSPASGSLSCSYGTHPSPFIRVSAVLFIFFYDFCCSSY